MFPLGVTIVTYRAKDNRNVTITSCSFTVEVVDNIPPTLTCPADFDVSPVNGECRFVIPDYSFLANTSDNCSITILQTPLPGAVITGLGSTQLITLEVRDLGNNSRTCSFIITLRDPVAPVVNCRGNGVFLLGANCRYVVPDYNQPGNGVVSDNCEYILTQTPAAGTVFTTPGERITISLTEIRDGQLNTAPDCSFVITLQSNDPLPIIDNCPRDIFVAGSSNCEKVVTWTPPTVRRGTCSTPVLTSTHNPNSFFPVGTTTVTYTATNDTGSTTCHFDVVVLDTAAPVIANCPASGDVFLDENCQFIVPDYTAMVTATSRCVAARVTQSVSAGQALGGVNTQHTITLTATDEFSNTSRCDIVITLRDNINPVISNLPSDIDLSAGPTSCEAFASWTTPTASDNCGIRTFTPTRSSGSSFPVGTTTVTYTATDVSGNRATGSFNVTVRDVTSPVFTTCVNPNIITTAAINCKAIVSWTAPTASDRCSAVSMTTTHQSGSQFDIGTTVVTYTAEDADGNKSTCSFNVIVNDITTPVVTCTDITVAAGNGCTARVSWTFPVNDCSAVTITSTPASGSVFVAGRTIVTNIITDAFGNSSTCTFNVIVEDRTSPVFTMCNSEIQVIANNGCQAVVTWTAPTVSDNCDSSPRIITTHTPGSTFALGTTKVTYTATDASGNKSTCEFNVLVTNENAPAFTACPANIEMKASESGKVAATWIVPRASVVCGTVSLSSTQSSGDLFPVGTTEVQYVATGSDGRTAICSFLVIVTYREILIEVYQLITPNGDGNNDALFIKGLDSFNDNTLAIVDRWGGLIYSAAGYDNESVAWDGGNTKGDKAPAGTYFYTLTVQFRDERLVKRGFVELVR